MELWVRDPLASGTQLVQWPTEERSVWSLLRARCQAQSLPEDHLYVKCNGHLVNFEDQLQDGAIYSLEPRLCGGKGGFGSMLRALGAQIEKTTNREACRDLSGRRLRDVNHEKAMAEWVKQQAEREADKEQRRLEKLKRKLVEPKHFFTNPVYQQQCHEMAERLEDSVLKGMQASSSTVVSPVNKESQKRPNEPERGEPSEKKRCFWLGVEGLEEDPDSSRDSSSSEDDHSPCSSTSCTMSAGNFFDTDEPKEPCPSISEDSAGCSSATTTVGKPQEQAEVLKNDLVEETLPSKIPLKEKCKEAKEEDGQADASKPQESVNELQGPGSAKIDLLEFHSAAELEVLGLEKLKFELMALGLKCGGTLQERAARLFSVRGLPRDQIDPALFAKPSKGKKK